ncbi:ABC transporter related protein [Caldalkalibacillus thermarum TA2.A1]|uniref:ABC transporter ATP-binding protein n=1 Tax=Caldalkalibacillus thermarum (strain TA2.A1) TaxID=986075 RepID=F5L6Q9_CALTT|nr:ABC transporter ATP-binding protein [Caldalkalibacillus thermarum]EGL82952.1 ABC transporter related protein [Caldalkalibacillus thermarum TA2.A1]QZT33606.1 ABC transporter ATP-binding protein [Caldalkalibacillus thermarum TA2.A1]
MIQLINVGKRFKDGSEWFEALTDINLTIENGEFVSIMGPSGSGKSTLMNILGCLDRASAGTYLLNGINTSEADDVRLAAIRNQYIGFVFQQFHLLPRLTALQNVELPLIYAGVKKKMRLEKARQALESVGLGDRLHHLPNQLSGGQKQRVSIARAIVNDPHLILADEPTGALDTVSGEQVMRIFQRLNEQGKTIILVTHDPEIAAYTRRHLLIRDGRLLEDRREVC